MRCGRARRCADHGPGRVPNRVRAVACTLAALVTTALPAHSQADPPLSYLTSFGARADPIIALTWGLIAISVVVILMTIVLLLGGAFRGRRLPSDTLPGEALVERASGGILWIVIGVAGSTAALLAAMVWTVATLAAVGSPPPDDGNAVNIRVIGHQWWWEVQYVASEPARSFTTANEIHVPVGRIVKVKLDTADVIHSFWVPALTGKTDLIPGQTNNTWFEASRPGVYRGQCTEYCGRQHAHMALEVVAQSSGEFNAWWDRQLEEAPEPTSQSAALDQQRFMLKCAVCHSVRGTPAGGRMGPDLSHLMTRRTVAAATLPNTVGSLTSWIADPQHAKPGNLMPQLDMSGTDVTRIRRFLETLK